MMRSKPGKQQHAAGDAWKADRRRKRKVLMKALGGQRP